MHDLQAIQRVLEAQWPDLRLQSFSEFNDEGQNNRLFVANGHIVVRMPRYSGGEVALEREAHILRHIDGRLSLKTPKVLAASPVGTQFGMAFLAYERLEGQPLWNEVLERQTTAEIRRTLAHQLGSFLAELHHLPLWDEVRTWPIMDSAGTWIRMYEEIRAHLFPAMRPDARRAVEAHFGAYLQDAALRSFAPCLRHGDFGSGNILSDPIEPSIAGVLDFGSAGVGDPAIDLAAASCFGDSMYADICAAYPGATAHLARASFYRGTFALQEALHGFRTGDREAYWSGMESYV